MLKILLLATSITIAMIQPAQAQSQLQSGGTSGTYGNTSNATKNMGGLTSNITSQQSTVALPCGFGGLAPSIMTGGAGGAYTMGGTAGGLSAPDLAIWPGDELNGPAIDGAIPGVGGVSLNPDGSISVGNGFGGVSLGPDGSISVGNGLGGVSLGPDGLSAGNGLGGVSLGPDGISGGINGLGGVNLNSDGSVTGSIGIGGLAGASLNSDGSVSGGAGIAGLGGVSFDTGDDDF